MHDKFRINIKITNPEHGTYIERPKVRTLQTTEIQRPRGKGLTPAIVVYCVSYSFHSIPRFLTAPF
jgi:hypothetical protein